MEAKERETGFSLANASIVSDRFRASKKADRICLGRHL